MSQTVEYVNEVGRRAKAAARVFGQTDGAQRSRALLAIADARAKQLGEQISQSRFWRPMPKTLPLPMQPVCAIR